MRKIIGICLLSLFITSCNDNKRKLEREGEPDVLYVENADNEMNSAIAKAKETFPEFEKAFQENNPNFENFTIKQKFETSDGGGEHIWIGDLKFKDGQYSGVVQNEPVDVKQIKLGDSIKVSLADISDWMYIDKKVVKGGYTVKVLRKQMSQEERSAMDGEGLIYE
ncbi:uncharacterized protein YegJ (DUF2314 family) [Chryseobacterium ginsenosidimutans]|uniref:YegJ family protein n=1 Tax=Chryseobacterium ginsenosidimutans TaxID=687846 RepID=UPI0027843D4A|nr:DUF2314 domain-containing protein [Chryseobacterium ginsenosidimutans]MDQ0591769.1 uncharacterized protein YegJ (DUF2314 family) [Chryseobacterium ginsenosidimutans]